MARSGIETEYNGALYRSRLEARWAAMFDLLGIPFTYEPFDMNGYIPDFVLNGPMPVLVEVRPCQTAADYSRVIDEMTHRVPWWTAHPPAQCVMNVDDEPPCSDWPHDMLVVGANGFVELYDGGYPLIGQLGEYDPGECRCAECIAKLRVAASTSRTNAWRLEHTLGPPWVWSDGVWVECHEDGCKRLGHVRFTHQAYSYASRPCSHYDGHVHAAPKETIHRLWSEAHRATRWHK